MGSTTRAPPGAGARPGRAQRRSGPDAARLLAPSETAWLLLPPALLAAVVLIALAGPPLGQALLTQHFSYWITETPSFAPKPSQLARFVLVVACALAFALAVLRGAQRTRARPAWTGRAVLAAQALLLALLALCWAKQWGLRWEEVGRRIYFTPATIAVAALATAAGGVALARASLPSRLSALAGSPRWRTAAAAVAVVATVIWLLPAIYTDRSIWLAPYQIPYHLEMTFDEAMAVLNGRSPLVNMTTYGWLQPYLVAPLLAAAGPSLLAFTTIMTALSAVALLAVYGVLRHVARSAPIALALYLPFLATSLFRIRGTAVAPYTFGTYFAMFPTRYLGAFLLAWLTARHLDGDRPRRLLTLFALGGLVAVNNLDFGLPALAATCVALVSSRPPADRAGWRALGRGLAAGVAIAVAVACAVTLLRAGSLPHPGMVVRYARIFGIGGWENFPTPVLGFHLVVLATFVAALTTAAVRVAGHEPDRLLTGMLAWIGVFGLGTGAYYTYRSHPDVLIAHFSTWALALALLAIAAVRAVRARRPRRATLPELAVLLGLALAVCSLAQAPAPWRQLERIRAHRLGEPLRLLAARDFVRRRTHPRERVAILVALGHRVAYEAHVVNVLAYTGMRQMPTAEQLEETIATLRREHGSKLFVGQLERWPHVDEALEAAGFVPVRADRASRLVEWVDREGLAKPS